MKKFLGFVVFGALAFGLGYGYANGNIHADAHSVSAHR